VHNVFRIYTISAVMSCALRYWSCCAE